MREGKEDGFGTIYDNEGRILLLEGERVIALAEGYFDPGYMQTGSYDRVAKGVIYLTNRRIVFVGTSSWLAVFPMHSIDLAHFSYQVVKKGRRIVQDREANYFKYVEVSRAEIKEVKKTFTGEISVSLEGGPVKFTSKSKEFKNRVFAEFK